MQARPISSDVGSTACCHGPCPAVRLVHKIIRASNTGVFYLPSFVAKVLASPHEYLLRRVPFPLPTPTGRDW